MRAVRRYDLEREEEDVFSIGERTVKADAPFGWKKNIDASKLDFNRPIVLCLGGTDIDSDKLANCVAEQAQNLLGLAGVDDDRLKQEQLLSVVYPANLVRLFNERNKFMSGENLGRVDYIEKIYNTVFRPIIYPNGVVFSDYEDVKRKLRNITIFSHCHGTFVASELIDYLQQDLNKISGNAGNVDGKNAFSEGLLKEVTNIMLSPRKGAQRSAGALNIGFTFASDNFPDVEGENVRDASKFENSNISDFSADVVSGKVKGSDIFYYKDGSLNSFWDTNTFGADIEYVESRNPDFWGRLNYITAFKDCFSASYHFHLLKNYCSVFANFGDLREDGWIIKKNEKGQNFTKVIAKALQNAVSLSIQGKERNLENVISNDTKVVFEQGEQLDNFHFKDVKFDGSLEAFAATGAEVLRKKDESNNKGKVLPITSAKKDANVQKLIADVKANTI